MAEVVVLPGLAAGSGAGGDRVAVDENFGGAYVLGEAAGVVLDALARVFGVSFALRGRLGSPVAQPFLQLKEGHGLLGVMELARDRGPGPMTGDVAADIGAGDTGLLRLLAAGRRLHRAATR
ncbi:hypothetical protein ABZT28_55975 [Streptomyces sp. NPDC005388]|uniref:hypothetical protein n=1 Tax=Streptomyces sp. NPDC005388 TaxID=3156717 RepID=UPI0033B02A92